MSNHDDSVAKQIDEDWDDEDGSDVRTTSKQSEQLQKKTSKDMAILYDERFFNKDIINKNLSNKSNKDRGSKLIRLESFKLNKLINEALCSEYSSSTEEKTIKLKPKEEQYFGRGQVEAQTGARNIEGSPLEISKLILIADFVKNDPNLVVSDPRVVRLLGKTGKGFPTDILLNFSSPQFESAPECEATGMYVSPKRVDIITMLALAEKNDIRPYLVTERLMREAILLMNRDEKLSNIKHTLSANAAVRQESIDVGVVKLDLKKMTLESDMMDNRGEILIIRNGNLIEISSTKKVDNFISMQVKDGKMLLKGGDLVLVMSHSIIEILKKIAEKRSNETDKAVLSDGFFSEQLLNIFRNVRTANGKLDKIELVDKLLTLVNRYQTENYKTGISPSQIALIEVPENRS